MSTTELWTSILACGLGPLDMGLHMVDGDDPSFFDPIFALLRRWRVLDLDLFDPSLARRAPFSHLRRLWLQLTHLRMTESVIPSRRCQHLLSLCESLVELYVKVRDQETTPWSYTHPGLRTLDFHAPDGGYVFLRSLTLPKLERLPCNMGFYRLNPTQTAQLVAFFARSGDALQSLALCDTYVDDSGEAAFLLAALPHLPRLRALSILPSGSFAAPCSAFTAFHLSDALLAALAAGRLLPRLQHIAFHSCVGFADMVCACGRRAGPRGRRGAAGAPARVPECWAGLSALGRFGKRAADTPGAARGDFGVILNAPGLFASRAPVGRPVG
ncbi:hypothetical protein B0H17DRAFT_1175605 [Mycena rosella]|uniref:Uncharacterized protein n=1 Tax=Mycena rosella TaxID=1033263 RepID=A0AAD7GSP5_MYCRO|nr:hypothetical protein B0H17DRAFT_1175605 [Mycena rosella]